MGKHIIIDNVPEDVHAKFKSKVAMEQVSIKDKIISLITEYLNKQDK